MFSWTRECSCVCVCVFFCMCVYVCDFGYVASGVALFFSRVRVFTGSLHV